MENGKYNFQLILGLDIYLSELQLIIHQPTLEELAMTMMTSSQLNQIIGVLTVNAFQQEEIELTNFQSFMLVYSELKNELKKRLDLVLDILFPNCKLNFIPGRSIYIEQKIGEINKTIMIDEQNFDLLQEALKEIFCITDTDESEGPVYNTQGELANKIKEKILKGRKKVAERKAMFNQETHENSDSLVKYLSIVSIATGISLNELKKYTLYQLYDILNRYNLWFNYDLDLRIRLAGGEVKQEVEPWTKNIH